MTLSAILYSNLLLSTGVICFLFFIEKSKLLHWSRVFVYSIIVLSIGLPLVKLTQPVTPILVYQLPAIDVIATVETTAQNTAQSSAFLKVYWWGVALVAAWITIKILVVFYRVKHNRIKGSYSFLNKVVVADDLAEEHKQWVRAHEYAHLEQRHTIDLIVIEVLTAIFWMNPMVWILKHKVKALHEYLADAMVSQKLDSDAKREYAQLLIAQQMQVHPSVLTHSFSEKSLLKKRLENMKNTVENKSKLKYAIGALLLISTFTWVACTENSSLPTDHYDTGEVFTQVEIMPEYKGGLEAMFQFLGENMEYPVHSKEKGLEGKVLVKFVVNKKGGIQDVEVVKSPADDMSEETIRIIQAMPDWEPGYMNDKPVNVQFVLPILFKIPKETSAE